ncbi:MAG: hypothetical protein LBQ88_19865 [Treponema sp.]|jgi:hypothetical protein|nr:hypothetical protein [Treponema sp.]
MNVFKVCLFMFFAGLLPLPGMLFAQVNSEELEQNQAPINFINYEGPHARIDTRAQIRDIGYTLGRARNAGAERSGGSNRYFFIHSSSGEDEDKLDADILGLGVDVGVDHIRNLRLIIQGYLEGAYEYSERDAALLAQFITIYNAVYRGDWDYFSMRYKTPVTANLSMEKAGLSIRFDEWPGQTLMLIPLGQGAAQTRSAVDSSPLTEPKVIDELRKDEDRGIDQRKEMVEFKENEAEEAEQRAAVRKEAIAEEEKKLAEERRQLEEAKQELAQTGDGGEAGEQIVQARPGEDTDGNRANAAENERNTEEAAAREEALRKQEEELQKREAALQNEREEARKEEELAEKKAEEAQRERQDIARDQQDLIAANQSESADSSLIAAELIRRDSPLGRILSLNPASGAVIRRSALDTINLRTLTFLGERIFAIAGENRGNSAIRLVEIDNKTLEMARQGADNLQADTVLVVRGNDFYAITVADGNCYLGRFNMELERQAHSSIAVHPLAAITFRGETILTQSADGTALILNARTLEAEE